MRKDPLVTGEFYHVYNRGVDKRFVFSDEIDLNRFWESIIEFNVIDPIGSIFEKRHSKKLKNQNYNDKNNLVEFVCYCINPNHFHFLIRQMVDNGISEFMKRLSGGYTKYFNEKERRSGSLFQGRFKSVHIKNNEYLLHLSAYINLNDKVHQFGRPTSKLATSKLVRTSWREYMGESKTNFCNKEIVLGQFGNCNEYKKFTLSSLKEIKKRKEELKEIEFES